ncbi:MAG: membrane-bound lytic murein transglycosylase MltF [Gammaproteobacteria bacterium]|nr:membrane-bound lytic murein transglycosylase MltF [Gammaproteobacteria bacterium]
MRRNHSQPIRQPPFYTVLSLTTCVALGACNGPAVTTLEALRDDGKLIVLTRNAPTTFYEGPEGPAGIEFDMLNGFADSLGVELEMVVHDDFNQMLPMLTNEKAHIAAAALTITDARKKIIRFSPSYQEIHQQIVYRLGTVPPKDVADLVGRQLEVVRGGSHAERLTALKDNHPDLEWTEIDDQSTEELLQSVSEGLLELTVADSNIVAITRQYYPELRVALTLGKSQQLAWAFPLSDDNSLYNRATLYLTKLKKSGELARLIERYYGASDRFNYINLAVYQARIEKRLPNYQSFFERAGRKYEVDWRLLAAIGYQESYWDPQAVSPTGVRGVMMLTQPTAKQLGVLNRVDPGQSIDGGSRYIRILIDKMPSSVKEPDRTWMALAAYNVGINHVADARIITRRLGRNPNRWNDVKQSLPLLSRRTWYKKTRHGYARGIEPVRFVTRIRTYYDVLVKIDSEIDFADEVEDFDLRAPAI